MDIDLLKHHIRTLSDLLRRRARGAGAPLRRADDDAASLVALHRELFGPLANRYSGELDLAAVRARFTRLCALRAHARGRLHFSARTDLARAHWVLGVPCKGAWDPSLPGGWRYLPITREVQAAWLEGLASEYMKKEDERLPAG